MAGAKFGGRKGKKGKTQQEFWLHGELGDGGDLHQQVSTTAC